MREFLKVSFSIGATICLVVTASIAHGGYISTLDTIAGADKISHWNLNESSGTTAADAWTTGTFDGTAGVNNGTYSGTGYTLGVAGPKGSDGFLGFDPSNKAVSFSGNSSQLLKMADSASFAGVNGGPTALSMLMWVKIDQSYETSNSDFYFGGLSKSTGSDRYGFSLISNRDHAIGYPNVPGNGIRGYYRLQNNASEINLDTQDRVWDDATVNPSGNPYPAFQEDRDGDWHFVVLTIHPDQGAGKRMNVFVDGAQVATRTVTNSAGNGLGLATAHTSGLDGFLGFGNDLAQTSRALIGQLDEISLVSRALSASEVGQLWQAAVVPEPCAVALFNIAGLFGLIRLRQRRSA